MRVLYAILKQETNTFTPAMTSLDRFRRAGGLYEGNEIVERLAGTRSEAGGVMEALRQTGVQGVPLLWAEAPPFGRVGREAFDYLVGRLLSRVEDESAEGVDAVVLSLHGAMAAEHLDDADGHILHEVRRKVGYDIPLGLSLDMHANITRLKTSEATLIVGYKHEPHTDMYETGYRTAELTLQAAKSQIHPTAEWIKIPMITPAEKHDTTGGPMKLLQDYARNVTNVFRLHDLTVFPVQPWLDVEELGWSVVAVGEAGREEGREAARSVAERCWSMRAEFLVQKTPIEEVVSTIASAKEGPIVVSDGSDSTNAGAPGDCTALLAALLGRRLGGEVLLNMVDPEAVDEMWDSVVGEDVDTTLGGKRDTFSKPVRVRGRIVWRGEAGFTLKGEMGRGLKAGLGRTVVLEAGDLRIVVSEQPGWAHDPELYRCVGLEPRIAKAVVVKSPTSFKEEYSPFAKKILYADTPGLATHNLKTLNYKKAPRPLFPLDEGFDWRP